MPINQIRNLIESRLFWLSQVAFIINKLLFQMFKEWRMQEI